MLLNSESRSRTASKGKPRMTAVPPAAVCRTTPALTRMSSYRQARMLLPSVGRKPSGDSANNCRAFGSVSIRYTAVSPKNHRILPLRVACVVCRL